MLDYFSLNHPLANIRSGFSMAARKKMYSLFLQLLEPGPESSILDVGVTPDESLIDSNYFEKFYPHQEKITAVSIENIDGLKKVFPKVNFLQVQPGKLPFQDDQFDVVFCSAVIEHVGSENNQISFLQELIRVSRSCFVTTPNRWHPIEFHTILPVIHWLPKDLHRRILRKIGYGFLAKEDNLNLLTCRDIKDWGILPDGYHVTSVKFLGFPSNLIVYGKK